MSASRSARWLLRLEETSPSASGVTGPKRPPWPGPPGWDEVITVADQHVEPLEHRADWGVAEDARLAASDVAKQGPDRVAV
jgi:hypothetical protein